MNSKKAIIVLILFLLFVSSSVFAIVKPTSNFYVNDYANLLNSETENYIMNINQNLNAKTKAQVVVVTVKNLEGSSLENYSTELFRNFGIGDSKLNNGVLMLIALEERLSRIEVGYGLEGILNDAKTGRIQDNYMIPYLKQNNWDEGIKNGFSAIVNEIEKEYNVSVGTEEVYISETINESVLSSLISFSLFLTIIVKIITINKANGKLIKTIYLLLLAIISFVLSLNIITTIMILLFNLFVLISRGRQRWFLRWRRRLFWWRRLLWWRWLIRRWTEAQEVFKKIGDKNMIYDVLGWIGMILLLIAYILLSSNKLKNGIPYQTLNLIASICMSIGLLPKNAWFSFALQVIFAIIAIITIIAILIEKSKNQNR